MVCEDSIPARSPGRPIVPHPGLSSRVHGSVPGGERTLAAASNVPATSGAGKEGDRGDPTRHLVRVAPSRGRKRLGQ